MANDIKTNHDHKTQELANREQLKLKLLGFLDENHASHDVDSRANRNHVKFKLLNGSEISIADIRRIKKQLADKAQPYKKAFRRAYYEHIFRLKGWPVPVGGIKERPHVVATYTNELIYQRFPKDTLPMLQSVNPYIGPHLRLHKHHQWFNELGRQQLLDYIEEAIAVMSACKTWYEFVEKYCNKYGLPYQIRMELGE